MFDRIHDDDHLKALHQPQHEMHATDADIHDLNMCGESACAEAPNDLDTETIIPAQQISKAGDQGFFCRQGAHLSMLICS
jgi:hypothetical protein